MKPLSLTIRNFRSFREEQTFEFTGAGLHYMPGENRIQPRLEGNGVGKSSIWDALCWCSFNKTTRGLRAGEVANWQAGKDVEVSFTYLLKGVTYRVTRTWGPISWTLTDLDTGEVEELSEDSSNTFYSHLRLDYLPFLHSILMAQQQPMFLDLKPKEKSAIFSEVMKHDEWLLYSERASGFTSTYDHAIRECLTMDAAISGQLESYLNTNLEEEIRSWDKNRKMRLDDIEDEYVSLSSEADKLDKRINACFHKMEKHASLWVSDSVRELKNKLSEAEQSTLKLAIPLASINKELEMLSSAKNSTGDLVCKECGQPIKLSQSKKQDEELKRRIQRLNQEKDDNIAKRAEGVKSIGNLKKELEEAGKKLRELSGEYSELQKEHATSCQSQARINSRLDSLEKEMDSLLTTTNPFIAKQESISALVTDLQCRQEVIRSLQAELQEKKSLSEFWVREFKELRLHLIEDSLKQLELEVNSCVLELGLVGWRLYFEIDRETKSGSIQKGFTVRVQSPDNDKPVPWEAWSGGESQRLRIATTMGLANLIRTSTGAVLDLEVWDEPTQYMSNQGVTDLLDSMQSRSSREDRQIWIVDHRSLGYGKFSSVMEIVKEKSGSQIQRIK